MFSVAIRGYGIVLWEDGQWRTFSTNESVGAMLVARVELALSTVAVGTDERDVRESLLSISGAGLFSADCDHGPGECHGESAVV